MPRYIFLVVAGLALTASTPRGQLTDKPGKQPTVADLIDFDVSVSPKEARRGQVVRVTVTGVPHKDWYTYSMTTRTADQAGPAVSRFKVTAVPGLVPLGPIDEMPAPKLERYPMAGDYLVHKGKFTWSFDVLVQPDAKPGALELTFAVDLQACNKMCIQGAIPLKATVAVQPGEAVAVPEEIRKRAAEKFPPPAREVKADGP